MKRDDGMFIYICCCGGTTSAYVCKSVQNMKLDTSIYVDSLFPILEKYEQLKTSYDIVLAYGSAEFINERNIKQYQLHTYFDRVWIAPHARYLRFQIENLLTPHGIEVHTMDMVVFGKIFRGSTIEDLKQLWE